MNHSPQLKELQVHSELNSKCFSDVTFRWWIVDESGQVFADLDHPVVCDTALIYILCS